jgi:hypothetical protein
MIWWGWLILSVYLLAALIAWRMLAGHFAWMMKYSGNREPSADEWVAGAFVGLLVVAGGWVAIAVFELARMLWRVSHLPTIGAEADAERRYAELERMQRVQRIAELERRLDLPDR